FQGMRAKYLLIVVDEACGVASTLWTGLTSMMTGAHVRVLAIGNPDDPSAEFAKICLGADPVAGGMSAREWNVIPISLFDTPAFSGEEVPAALAEVLVGPEWLRSFEQDVAVEGEPLYTSKVLGQFPEDASTGVIPFSWLRQSI